MLEEFEDASDPDNDPWRRRRPPRPSRARRVVVVLIAIVLLVCIGAGGYGWFISSKVDSGLTHENLLGDSKDDTTTTTGKKLVDDAGDNYLVIGSDARPGETFSRADVIQLVHVDKDHKNVWLIHFPRDLFVPIPGHGKDKINSAYAYGQAPLLVQTIQDLVGVKINHVAKTDFEGFRQLTDALGGVTVNNPQPGPNYPAGSVELNGTKALDFVRQRKQLKEGDISRGQRQQAWLKAIMRETLDPQVLLDPRKLNGIIEAGTEHTIVDKGLTGGVIRREAIKLRSVRGNNIHFITAPFSGYGTTDEGASIDILDEQGMAALSDALRTDDLAGYAETAE